MVSREQIEFFEEHGFVHIPHMYTEEEMDQLDAHLDFIMDQWAVTEMGWTGPWRQVYMDAETEKRSKLTSIHDLHFYSDAWLHAVSKPELAEAVSALIPCPNVELHHTTLHAKPPQTGHPFPMHQDSPFYQHTNGRFLDVLVHLDDTCHENGEIRFLSGSHKLGHLEHVVETETGPCTPHLPTDQYALADTTPVPAKRGDVVCFNIYTIHGSYINQTDRVRRMVRVGYRDPQNVQLSGQSVGRPGIMVKGLRIRTTEAAPLTNEAVA